MQLITSDSEGNLAFHPGYKAQGRNGKHLTTLQESDCSVLELPAYLNWLPHRQPLSQPQFKSPKTPGHYAVAAIPAHGYTRTLLPAYRTDGQPGWLPFFAYCAAGAAGNRIYLAALRTENDIRWDFSQYNSPDLPRKITAKLKRFPRNRILKHLSRCALTYHCFTAQNIFYERWEGGLPISPVCNAGCLGCISAQPEPCPSAPQERISFVPEISEIVELSAEHLSHPSTIISFGQGCEGEPLLQHELLRQALPAIRARTGSGTIHLNTNGSLPKALQALIPAGLDSVRVSLNSGLPERYENYFKPKGYRFKDVLDSLTIIKAKGAFLALNLLLLPGSNDTDDEIEALIALIDNYKPDMLQLRNLNIDPDYYFHNFPPRTAGRGIANLLAELRRCFPNLLMGNSTPAQPK